MGTIFQCFWHRPHSPLFSVNEYRINKSVAECEAHPAHHGTFQWLILVKDELAISFISEILPGDFTYLFSLYDSHLSV